MTRKQFLSEKAKAVVEQLATDNHDLKDAAGDGSFLAFIEDLIKELLPIIVGCFATPAKAAEAFQNPTRFQRARVSLHVARALRTSDAVDVMAGPLTDAILATARDVTPAELAGAVSGKFGISQTVHDEQNPGNG